MQKPVSFKSSKDYLLKGVLHIPKGKGQLPAVIVQHGLWANHQHPLIKSISCKLEKEGFIVFRFTWSGHKPSKGVYKDIMASQFVKDLKKGLAFLKRQPQVNHHRLGVIGHSLGAFVALIVASLSQDVRAVVAISSFIDAYKQLQILFKRGVAERHKDYLILWGRKVPKNHYQDRAFWKIKEKIPNIHCPSLIIHGDNDKTTMVADAKQIYQLANQPKDLKIIKGASHNFTNKLSQQKVTNLTVGWCKKYLAFKVSPVVNVLLECKGETLLLKRSQRVGTYRGLWLSVAGYLEKGNDVLTQAKEEVEEETGIKLKRLSDYQAAKSFKFIDKKIDRIWQIHPILIRLKNKPKIKLDWESSAYRWVRPSEIKKYQVVPSLLEVIKRVGLKI